VYPRPLPGFTVSAVHQRSVVDPRVHGVEQLRGVVASIMPSVPAGNPNAPSTIFSQKAADMILEDTHLA
jgi:choline dehydrogenase-like flavoprotein